MASASHCHWLFEAPPPIFASADAAPRASSVPADALGMQALQARRCNFDLNYRVVLLSVAAAEDFFLHGSRCACASCSRLLKHEQVWKRIYVRPATKQRPNLGRHNGKPIQETTRQKPGCLIAALDGLLRSKAVLQDVFWGVRGFRPSKTRHSGALKLFPAKRERKHRSQNLSTV